MRLLLASDAEAVQQSVVLFLALEAALFFLNQHSRLAVKPAP